MARKEGDRLSRLLPTTTKITTTTPKRRINVRLIELIKPTHKHKILSPSSSPSLSLSLSGTSACALIKLLPLSLLLLFLLLLGLHDLLVSLCRSLCRSRRALSSSSANVCTGHCVSVVGAGRVSCLRRDKSCVIEHRVE